MNKMISNGIIDHGYATSSICWVIPKLDMIITQSRKREKSNFGPNYIKMMEIVEKNLLSN